MRGWDGCRRWWSPSSEAGLQSAGSAVVWAGSPSALRGSERGCSRRGSVTRLTRRSSVRRLAAVEAAPPGPRHAGPRGSAKEPFPDRRLTSSAPGLPAFRAPARSVASVRCAPRAVPCVVRRRVPRVSSSAVGFAEIHGDPPRCASRTAALAPRSRGKECFPEA